MRNLTEVYKSDGSLCYSMESVCYCGQGCEVWFNNWYNAAGQLVAQSSSSPQGSSPLSCVPNGDAQTNVDSGVICVSPPPGPSCATGSCP